MGDGHSIGAREGLPAMHSWHRCRCGLLLCIAATLLLLGPVKHALDAARDGLAVSTRPVAANPSDGEQTAGGADRLIGPQRDQMAANGAGDAGELFILAGPWRPALAYAVSRLPWRIESTPRSGTDDHGAGSPRSPPYALRALPQG